MMHGEKRCLIIAAVGYLRISIHNFTCSNFCGTRVFTFRITNDGLCIS